MIKIKANRLFSSYIIYVISNDTEKKLHISPESVGKYLIYSE